MHEGRPKFYRKPLFLRFWHFFSEKFIKDENHSFRTDGANNFHKFSLSVLAFLFHTRCSYNAICNTILFFIFFIFQRKNRNFFQEKLFRLNTSEENFSTVCQKKFRDQNLIVVRCKLLGSIKMKKTSDTIILQNDISLIDYH